MTSNTVAEQLRSPECWSAIATLPTTIMTAPSSGAGPTCCGTSTTSAPATPKTPHWPDGPRQSTSSMSQPKPATITSPGKGVLPNWPGSGSCWPSAALSCLTRRRSRQAVPAHRAPHQGTLRLRGRTRSASGQQPRRAQPAPSGHQPQGQRGHPVGTWYRAQDDAGIHLRHLARPRSKPPRRLPSAARFPSTLNCYVGTWWHHIRGDKAFHYLAWHPKIDPLGVGYYNGQSPQQ